MSNISRVKKILKGKDFWGPPCWCSIHLISMGLRPGTEDEYEEFLWLFTYLLPCDFCKVNLEKKLKAHPPRGYLSDNMKCFFYSYMIHDLANNHIKKYHPESPKISPSFDEIKNIYIKGLTYDRLNFCENAIQATIYIFAATLRQENSMKYKRFLELLTVLLPDRNYRNSLKNFLAKHPVDPYLQSNHNAFFHAYVLNKTIHQENNRTFSAKPFPSHEVVKNFYFSSLGEECDNCKV